MKKRNQKRKISKNIFYVFILILLLIDLFLFFGMNWVIKNVGVVSIDEVIFHLKVPLEGTSHTMINDFILKCVVPTLLIFITIVVLFQKRYKYESIFTIKVFKKEIKTNLKNIVKLTCLIIGLLVLMIQLSDINKKFKVIEYIKLQRQNSKFIEENYVDPKSVKITFPDKKRNLIYIYLESMETTYMDRENGGNQDINLIPELTELAKKHISFSDKETLGGAYPMSGTGWTMGAMVAQTSGIPLNLPIKGNAYTGYGEFLPGAYSIGDILKKQGYNQMLILGSDAKFGGRDTFFKTHGNYIIKDYYSAKKDKIIGKNHYEFWGMEDSYLFEYAKKELTELSKKDEPFNLTMLTVNTHFPDGYVEKSCKEVIENNQYANSMICSSNQIGKFIEWIKDQDFYKNTTIVISGDHLSMAGNNIYDGLEYGDRRIYNVIINSALEPNKEKNRKFSAIDMYPTSLAALGVKIDGERLGLGTNLFSNKKTLLEEYEVQYMNQELSKKSIYYNNNILYKK